MEVMKKSLLVVSVASILTLVGCQSKDEQSASALSHHQASANAAEGNGHVKKARKKTVLRDRVMRKAGTLEEAVRELHEESAKTKKTNAVTSASTYASSTD